MRIECHHDPCILNFIISYCFIHTYRCFWSAKSAFWWGLRLYAPWYSSGPICGHLSLTRPMRGVRARTSVVCITRHACAYASFVRFVVLENKAIASFDLYRCTCDSHKALSQIWQRFFIMFITFATTSSDVMVLRRTCSTYFLIFLDFCECTFAYWAKKKTF